MQIRFLSLNHPHETGYLVGEGTKVTDYRFSQRSSVYWASKYDTYGDGMTQHSHELPIHLDDMEDFLASLAVYLTEGAGSDRQIHIELVERNWPKNYSLSNQRILFLAGLRQKDGKTTYFSLTENKVSSSDSKRHDKRWVEVPDWADGSPAAVYRLAFQSEELDFRDMLTRYALYDEIRDVISTTLGYFGKTATAWIYGENTHHNLHLHISQAFESVDLLVKSARYAESARRILDCYLSNTKSKRETSEEEQVA